MSHLLSFFFLSSLWIFLRGSSLWRHVTNASPGLTTLWMPRAQFARKSGSACHRLNGSAGFELTTSQSLQLRALANWVTRNAGYRVYGVCPGA